MPGYRLFQYPGDHHKPAGVDSTRVNEWLKQTSAADNSAKDFRTWMACLSFLEESLSMNLDPKMPVPLKRILENLSDKLNYTPAILQKSYIHPRLIDLYNKGKLQKNQWLLECEDYPGRLRKHEALFLQLLAHQDH